jgi:hypothetical protein
MRARQAVLQPPFDRRTRMPLPRPAFAKLLQLIE